VTYSYIPAAGFGVILTLLNISNFVLQLYVFLQVKPLTIAHYIVVKLTNRNTGKIKSFLYIAEINLFNFKYKREVT